MTELRDTVWVSAAEIRWIANALDASNLKSKEIGQSISRELGVVEVRYRNGRMYGKGFRSALGKGDQYPAKLSPTEKAFLLENLDDIPTVLEEKLQVISV